MVRGIHLGFVSIWLLAVNRTYDPASGVIELEDGRKVGISLKGPGHQFVKVD